jgi:hypothetical protein
MAKLSGALLAYGSTIPPVVLVGAVLSLAILVKLIQLVRDPLRTVPGPFLARFTRLWYLQKVWKGDFEKTNIELHQKHGIRFFILLISVYTGPLTQPY